MSSEVEPLLLAIDPGDASAGDILEYYLALNAYYKSLGGEGLKFTDRAIDSKGEGNGER